MHCLELDDLLYEQTVGSLMYTLFVLCIGYFSPLLGFSVNVNNSFCRKGVLYAELGLLLLKSN